jgi:catechol 2,3-dioxygenase-like lactoylglutathione lyase family enzyme
MIRSLQYVALHVPDMEMGRKFYETMGLEGRMEGEQAVYRCAGRAQDQLRLVPGEKKEIAWVTWGTRAGEIEQITANLKNAGVPLAAAPAGFENNGLWVRDPDGILVNVIVADPVEQTRPAVEINNPGTPYVRRGRRGAPNRNIDTRPRKLGHILKFTTDINRDIEFYTRLMGMKLSDRIGDELAGFLRCGGDSDHHTLALASSEAPGLHHLSWEMGNLDQLRMCAEKMLAAGYQNGWGIGRHVYGSNYFHYIRDPWMGLNEFFWDIDFIPENAEWDIEKAEANEESLFQWATEHPLEDFLKNYEAAQV